jgi:hypothetical protein
MRTAKAQQEASVAKVSMTFTVLMVKVLDWLGPGIAFELEGVMHLCLLWPGCACPSPPASLVRNFFFLSPVEDSS